MADVDRRDFLKMVGAGAGAAAAATGCEPVEKLIPYVVQPEEITPGLPVFYASTCQECSAGCGLHVRTREGRPIKLEGNPEHPVNRGALCARGQAAIGRTYHPDRHRGPQRRAADGTLSPLAWQEAVSLVATRIREARGATWILGGQTGPTLTRLLDRFVEAVGAGGSLVYEPFAYEALATASERVFGVAGRPVFDLSGTDFVIDFGSDFLESWISPTEHARQIEEARDVSSAAGRKARLVYVGPRLSMTASSADEWLPAKPGTEALVALAIAGEVAHQRGAAAPAGAPDLARAAAQAELSPDALRRVARGLADSERPVALPPGVALSGRNAVEATAAVLALDVVLGAVGTRVLPVADSPGAPASFREVQELVSAMNAGRVRVLVVHDANPLYSLPPEAGFAEALEKVDFVVSLASLPDETSAAADLILPTHTSLESWGDASPRPGVHSLVQPTLRPLYDTVSLGDALLEIGRAVAGDGALPAGSFRGLLESEWRDGDFRGALARGGSFRSTRSQAAGLPGSPSVDAREPQLDGDGPFVLLPVPSPLLGDGRGANLPWLQETPDPVTKISWQSWAEISKKAAESLGVRAGDVIAVETPSGRLELPVLPRGGIRDDVVAIPIGQGHTVGRYASRARDGTTAPRGVNVITALPAATDTSGGRAWLTSRATVTKTGRYERLALTQGTDNKRGRQLGEAVSLAALAHGEPAHFEGGGEGGHGGEPGSHEIREPYDAAAFADPASDNRWGMTIDVDRCTGCSACMVACSIENNIPNVGEEGVLRSRQMSWIRIERYVGDGYQQLQTGRPGPQNHEELGSTDVRHSVMLCQHCGAAPCEPVCPVFATYHNEEGLNGMIYNRCIGTRYCSNNCPYKVRRFNWFDYQIETWPEPMRLMLNPDVTVRGQGVMEKCTFCVQRIEGARQLAKDEGRPIADGEVTPACAQTCPTQAITFGNLRDEKSAAVRKAEQGKARDYHALHVLNTRPAITYLAKVKRSPEGGKA